MGEEKEAAQGRAALHLCSAADESVGGSLRDPLEDEAGLDQPTVLAQGSRQDILAAPGLEFEDQEGRCDPAELERVGHPDQIGQ